MPTTTKIFSVRLPVETVKQLKHLAITRGTSVQTLMQTLLAHALTEIDSPLHTSTHKLQSPP